MRLRNDSSYYIDVVIKAENKGNRNMKLNLSDAPPVIAAKLTYPKDGSTEPLFGKSFSASVYTNAGKMVAEHVIRVGEVYRYRVVIRVFEPGIYLIAFNT